MKMFDKLNGKKTTIGAFALLVLLVLRKSGYETDLETTTETLTGAWTLLALLHKLIKSKVAK